MPIELIQLWATCIRISEKSASKGEFDEFGVIASYVQYGHSEKIFAMYLTDQGFNEIEIQKVLREVQQDWLELEDSKARSALKNQER